MSWLQSIFLGTYKHTCKDGTVRFIHRNVDKAFPLAVREQQKRFNADLTAQKKASAKLNSAYTKKEIENLEEKLIKPDSMRNAEYDMLIKSGIGFNRIL